MTESNDPSPDEIEHVPDAEPKGLEPRCEGMADVPKPIEEEQ
jgi:hypothetical protein